MSRDERGDEPSKHTWLALPRLQSRNSGPVGTAEHLHIGHCRARSTQTVQMRPKLTVSKPPRYLAIPWSSFGCRGRIASLPSSERVASLARQHPSDLRSSHDGPVCADLGGRTQAPACTRGVVPMQFGRRSESSSLCRRASQQARRRWPAASMDRDQLCLQRQ